MDWFSKNFPSLARLISVLGKTTQRRAGPRTRGAGRRPATTTTGGSQETVELGAPTLDERPLLAIEEPDHGDPIQAEEAPLDLAPSEIDQDALTTGPEEAEPSTFVEPLGEQPPIGEELGTKPVESGKLTVSITANTTQNTSMEQMYNTWVELGETMTAAREEMQTLLANRRKAEALRAEAQEVLEQSEAAWDEAGRLGDVARKAIERGFTLNLPGFAARLRMADDIEQARITQAQLRRSTTNEAWEEADRARQKATTELLKALTAIAAAASQVERELRETANLSAVAESLHSSASEDLKSARGIDGELAVLGREAFSLLAVSDVSVEARGDETPTPVSITGELETQPVETRPSAAPATDAAPQRQDAVVAGGGIEDQDLLGTQAAPETRERHEAGGVGAGNEVSGAIVTPPVRAEAVETATMPAADDLRREFEAATSVSGIGGSGIQEAVEHTNADSEAPVSVSQDAARPNSAADELERELAALRSQFASTEPPVGPTITPAGTPAAPGGIAVSDTQEWSSEAASGGFLRRGELNRNSEDRPEAVPFAPEPEPSTPVPESYSGRVYLMFPASLTQDELESVWENLEGVAGNGAISDHRLISRQDGVQFTLELGNKDLVVDRLLKQMPGATLIALAQDKLRIDWPRHS